MRTTAGRHLVVEATPIYAHFAHADGGWAVMVGSRRVVIVGAGIGGLTTALRLRRHGFQVMVAEKQSRAGGRSNVLHEAGFRVDTGPTILVMKDTFQELYRSLGLRLEDRLRLVQLEPNYRIRRRTLGCWASS